MTESNNFTRVVVIREFGNTVPRVLSQKEVDELQSQVDELRYAFIQSLILIDSFIVILGGGLSYFLAGKTLSSIAEILKRQKEFVSDASHELRTPLAAIRTTCEVALRSKNKSIEQFQIVVEQVHEESIRLGKIVQDLLTLSRLDSGLQKLDIKPVYLDEIILKTIEEMRPVADKKGVVLKHELEKVRFNADQDKIKQLFLILLDNAIKFTDKGGVVRVVTQPIPSPTFWISDTGVGMTAEQQKRIFDRFYQVDSARHNEGSGLGLAIAQSIVQMHTGVITLESTKGKGSTFKITF